MNQLLDRDCSILVIFFLLESRKKELTWWPLWQLSAQSVFCLHHAGISSYPSSGCYWISAGQREKAGWKYEIIFITFDNLIPVFRDFFTLLHRSVSKWGEFLNLTSPPYLYLTGVHLSELQHNQWYLLHSIRVQLQGGLCGWKLCRRIWSLL